MLIFPAIDLYEGKAVRLYKGDYAAMTVYSDNPPELVESFKQAGATHLHVVDLEGARDGSMPNFALVEKIVRESGMFVQLGGGVRSFEVIARCLSAGISRVILGTAAVEKEGFVAEAVARYGEKIAVSVDIKDNIVAVKGWTERSNYTCFAFCDMLQSAGVKTLICTDISRDGAMRGTNLDLYEKLCARYDMNIIASGGVDSLEAVQRLKNAGLHGAIVGRAYYTGALDLAGAIRLAGENGGMA